MELDCKEMHIYNNYYFLFKKKALKIDIMYID